MLTTITNELVLRPGEILVFRTSDKDGKSHNNHQWLLTNHSGSCPDWQDTEECGHGFHALPWAVGDLFLVNTSPDRHFQVLKVDTREGNYREFGGKCKFNKYKQIFCKQNALVEAILLIQQFAPKDSRINWANQIGKDNSVQVAGFMSTQTTGYWSTQTAGHRSTQTAGDRSTQTAGDRSTQTAGHESTQTAGSWAMQMAGYNSTQTAGCGSTQTAGDYSTQTAEDGSTQTAGNRSTQTAGDGSTQTAGNRSTQTAGIKTVQIIRYYNNNDEWTVKTRVITKKEANKAYRFENEDWVLVK